MLKSSIMRGWFTKQSRWFWPLLLAGFLLRLGALPLFPFAEGDANLFCLAAEHWAESGRLTLGMKTHFAPDMAAFGLDEPQSQHLPLWPWLGGIILKVLPSLDSYAVFQIESLLFGTLLLILVYQLGEQTLPEWANFCAVTLAAGSPLLIEYSANGSLYSLMACQWLLLFLLLPGCSNTGWRPWLATGALLGLSFLTHYPQLLMLPVILIWLALKRREVSCSKAAALLLVALLPWGLWAMRNQALFGDPFFSSTLLNFQRKWGLLETRLIEGRLVQQSTSLPPETATRMVQAFPLNALQFLGQLASRCFYWPLAAVLIGGWAAARRRVRLPGGGLGVLLAVLYLAEVSFWGFIRPRFLVPVLPLVFLWSAAGFESIADSFLNRGIQIRQTGRLLVAVSTITVLILLLTAGIHWKKTPPVEQAASMRLAEWLKEQPSGTVLGYSALLDGGIQAVRIHRHPYVHGRNFLYQPQAAVRLWEEYHPRYVWCDSPIRGFVESVLPVRLARREGHQCVLIPIHESPTNPLKNSE